MKSFIIKTITTIACVLAFSFAAMAQSDNDQKKPPPKSEKKDPPKIVVPPKNDKPKDDKKKPKKPDGSGDYVLLFMSRE